MNKKTFLISSASSLLLLSSSLFAAGTMGPNGRDTAESIAAYDVHIEGNTPTINVPGAEASRMKAGEVLQGKVNNLIADNVSAQVTYDVTFYAALGQMDQSIEASTGSVSGLGLYKGKNLDDMGAVLSSMTFLAPDGTPLPVQLNTESSGGCTLDVNSINFFGGTGDTGLCSVVLQGSDLSNIPASTPGSVQYTMAAANSAQAGSTYANELSYRISAVQS